MVLKPEQYLMHYGFLVSSYVSLFVQILAFIFFLFKGELLFSIVCH